jgi:hypothetical protein
MYKLNKALLASKVFHTDKYNRMLKYDVERLMRLLEDCDNYLLTISGTVEDEKSLQTLRLRINEERNTVYVG